jgi:hypothetical protein
MDNNAETKRGRGRPPLPPEMKKPKRNYHKENGYAALKKFRENNLELRVLIPIASKPILDRIASEVNLSISALFLNAVEEKYDIQLDSVYMSLQTL